MFARHITLQLKAPLAKEFPVTFEKEIVPLLKKQRGFVDELLLVTPEKRSGGHQPVGEEGVRGDLPSGTVPQG